MGVCWGELILAGQHYIDHTRLQRQRQRKKIPHNPNPNPNPNPALLMTGEAGLRFAPLHYPSLGPCMTMSQRVRVHAIRSAACAHKLTPETSPHISQADHVHSGFTAA